MSTLTPPLHTRYAQITHTHTYSGPSTQGMGNQSLMLLPHKLKGEQLVWGS